MKNIMYRVGVIAVLALILGGCEIGTPVPKQEFAQKIADEFYKSLHDRKYEEAFSLVNADFFGPRTKEEWVTYFDKINDTLGPMESYKLKEPHVSTRLSGTFFIFEYRGKYEHGLGKELITLIHEINSDDPLRIWGYKIESSKLPEM